MGGDDKSPVWNLRVTITEKNPRIRTIKYAEAYEYIKLACVEQAESLHTHIAIVPPEPMCRSTVQAHIRKYLDISGNEDYSLTKPKKGDTIAGLYRYFCKGTGPDYQTEGPDITFNRDALVDVKKYHHDYWAAQAEFKAAVKAKVDLKIKEERKKKSQIIIEITEKYKDSKLKEPHLTDMITEAVMIAYQGNVKEDILYTSVQAITFQLNPEGTIANAVERIRRRLFPAYRL